MTTGNTIRRPRLWLELGGALVLALIGTLAPAYEESTHKLLTQLAVSNSGIARDFDLFVRLGFPNVASRTYMASNGSGPYTAAEMLPFGAEWEDAWYAKIAYNHFFDPQYNNRAGRGLDLGTLDGVPLVGNASVDWSLEDRGLFPDGKSPEGGRHTFSIRDAQVYFHAALTAGSYSERQAATAKMLQALGHVVHHIEDMAQPQHVRNDMHLELPLGMSFPASSKDFELYVKRREADIPGMVAAAAYPTPTFNTFRTFWHTPGPTPVYTGMAEFTAQNFFSAHSAFRVLPDGSMVNRPEFPLPARGSLVQVPRTVTINGRSYSRNVQVLVGDVYDGARNVTSTGVPLAQVSFLGSGPAAGAPAGRPPALLYVDREIWDAQLPILLPRAVAFSTGLINHFFRGKIAIARSADTKSWVISNQGTGTLKGQVTIYGEDAVGWRAALPGARFDVNLGGGASTNVTFPEPSNVARLAVVFRGQIGLDGDSTLSSGYWGVTGRVIPFSALPTPPPPVPCDTGWSDSFGAEGYDAVHTYGSTPGVVRVVFEGFGAAVAEFSMKAEGGTGRTLLTSGGKLSGYRSYSFYFDPAAERTTQIRQTVPPFTFEPGYNIRLQTSCPGGAVPALNRRNVTLKVVDNTCRVTWKLKIDGGAELTLPTYSISVPLTIGDFHHAEAGYAGGTSGDSCPLFTNPGGITYTDGTGEQGLLSWTFPQSWFSVK